MAIVRLIENIRTKGGTVTQGYRLAALLLVQSSTWMFAAIGQDDLNRSTRPNIVFVLTDDQAAWAMGSNVERRWFHDVPIPATPHMDRLAAEGITFRNFFCATPVCSPARVAIATGRYASEFGVDDFIPSPEHKLFDASDQVALHPRQSVTFAEVLHDAGYRTGLVGKWHLGDWTLPGNQSHHPTHHGFDEFMGLTSGGSTPINPILEKDGERRAFEGITTDILTDHAIQFVERSAKGDQPFLLCLHTRAPHGRWLPVAPEDWQPYADMDPSIPEYPDLDVVKVKKDMRQYLASTSGVDRNLGRLLETLDRLHLSDDTIVIFTSDHGYNMGHHGIVHKGNGIWATKTKPPGKTHHRTRVISDKYRPNMYDLSLKVPAIIRLPRSVTSDPLWRNANSSGTVMDHTATHLDLFPTLLQLSNVDVPANLPLRGRSLVPLLSGDPPADWDQSVFAQYSMTHYAVAKMRCYRTPTHKLVRDFHNEERDEFYDLQTDPGEQTNLIDDPRPHIRAIIEDLGDRMIAKMKSVDDPLLNAATPTQSRAKANVDAKRPNVVLILADDLAVGDLHGDNGKQSCTPRLDAFAAQSVRFNQAYSGSCVCAPARAALLTGRYPHRTGVVTLNMNQFPKLTRLRLDETTIANVLGDAGYATGLVGKWHVGRSGPYHPRQRGFDETESFDGSTDPAYYDYLLDDDGEVSRVNDGTYLTDDLSQRAIEFVRRNHDRAFFLHLAHYAPHRPLQAPASVVQRYREHGFDESTATIYAMIEVMDHGIGRLLDELEALQIADNTIVIFASDNGPDPLTGQRYNRDLRGTKYQVNEGGIRVPLFIRWPHQFQSGDRNQMVHFVDLMPTILDLCNVDAELPNRLDGETFRNALLDKTAKFTPTRYWQWNRGRPNYTHNAAIRQGRFKLIRPYVNRKTNPPDSNQPTVLFDLADDPTESRDVAARYPDEAESLGRQLQRWTQEMERDRVRELATSP